MRSCPPWRVKKWLTVGGCFLLMLPTGIPWCWGNIGMYALSYVAVRGQTRTGVDVPWVMSIYFMCSFTGICLAATATARKPRTKRLVLFLAVTISTGGLCLTYKTVQISVFMVTVSIGVVCGLGGGLVNGMALHYAGAWAGKDPGLVTAFVQSGYQFGNLFVHPLMSTFINPSNLVPSIEVNSIKLFSQPELLDRVPLGFILFGVTSLLLQIIGFVSVKDVTDEYSEEIQLTEPDIICNGDAVHWNEFSDDVPSKDINANKKLRDVIKIPSFYSLCFLFFLFENAIVVLVNYYKDYGAVWVKDDLFLAFMGNPFVAGCGLAYPLWGFVSDRIGVKKTLIWQFSSSSWLLILMFFTPMLNKWLYMMNTILLGFCLTPVFSILVVATRHYFGKTYFVNNLSYVTLLAMGTELVNPIILQSLLTIGWFYIFLYGAVLCFVCLIITVVTLPTG